MPKISWELNVKVENGPVIAESDTLAAEAYEEIEVIAKKKVTDKKVDVQPGQAGQIKFMLITASKYQGDKLSYKLGTAAGAKVIVLDAPQFFIGAGMISLLEPEPKEIYVTNKLDEDVKFGILVGRDATP